MELTRNDLPHFVTGAAFLGTGGGGDPYIGRLMLEQEFDAGRSIRFLDPMALDDDDLIVTCATMGAPTVMVERIPSAQGTVQAVRRIEQLLGRPVAAVMPIEAGGINATLPLVVGAQLDRPVVDADGMGRAFPELQMVTFSIYGCSATPVVLANDSGDTAILEVDDNRRCEHLARNLVVAMGGQAQIALYPLLGRAVKEFGVLHTLTLALSIGRALDEARRRRRVATDALVEFFQSPQLGRHARVLFQGKISDVQRKTSRGFAIGQIVVASLSGDGPPCAIDFQNEFLMARVADRPVAMVPDLICLLDLETGDPITTEAIRYGQRVSVMGVSVPSVMRTESALAVFGPRAFAFSMDYVPIERLGAPPTRP